MDSEQLSGQLHSTEQKLCIKKLRKMPSIKENPNAWPSEFAPTHLSKQNTAALQTRTETISPANTLL
jgi:hypothetical protein